MPILLNHRLKNLAYYYFLFAMHLPSIYYLNVKELNVNSLRHILEEMYYEKYI